MTPQDPNFIYDPNIDLYPIYPRDLLDIFIEDLHSKSQILRFSSSPVTIAELISLISEIYSIPPEELRLILRDKEISNFLSMTFNEIGLSHKDTVRLKLRLKGGRVNYQEPNSSRISPLLPFISPSFTPAVSQHSAEDRNASPTQLFLKCPEVPTCNFVPFFLIENSFGENIILILLTCQNQSQEFFGSSIFSQDRNYFICFGARSFYFLIPDQFILPFENFVQKAATAQFSFNCRTELPFSVRFSEFLAVRASSLFLHDSQTFSLWSSLLVPITPPLFHAKKGLI